MIVMRNRTDGVQQGVEVKLVFAITGGDKDKKNTDG
jgi:hypothetical protein